MPTAADVTQCLTFLAHMRRRWCRTPLRNCAIYRGFAKEKVNTCYYYFVAVYLQLLLHSAFEASLTHAWNHSNRLNINSQGLLSKALFGCRIGVFVPHNDLNDYFANFASDTETGDVWFLRTTSLHILHLLRGSKALQVEQTVPYMLFISSGTVPMKTLRPTKTFAQLARGYKQIWHKSQK